MTSRKILNFIANFMFLLAVPAVVFLLLAAADVWGGHHCALSWQTWQSWQFPKIVGCFLWKYESLSSGLIGGASVLIAAWLAWTIGQRQVQATRAQMESEVQATRNQMAAERAASQQTIHQKKYAMALALRLEVKRIIALIDGRITSAKLSMNEGKCPKRDQMIITVLSLVRGEREEISLLSDELQDAVLNLINEVDRYNVQIEAIAYIFNTPDQIAVTQGSLNTLEQLKTRAACVQAKLDDLLNRIREWRCQCGAFLDETFEVGVRTPCPRCGTFKRVIGIAFRGQGEGEMT